MTTSNRLVISGAQIPVDEHNRINLNSLHKASGTGKSKQPNYWFRLETTKELVAELEQATDLWFAPITPSRGGKNPGTFAHELLAISYAGWISPKFQLTVNQAFIDSRKQKMETQKPLSRLEVLTLALEAEKEVIRLNTEADENIPKVQSYDRLIKTDGEMCITDAAKALKLRPKELFNYLSYKKWIYKRPNSSNWIGYQDKIQRGYLVHKVAVIKLESGEEKNCSQVMITLKGLTLIGGIIENQVA